MNPIPFSLSPLARDFRRFVSAIYFYFFLLFYFLASVGKIKMITRPYYTRVLRAREIPTGLTGPPLRVKQCTLCTTWLAKCLIANEEERESGGRGKQQRG